MLISRQFFQGKYLLLIVSGLTLIASGLSSVMSGGNILQGLMSGAGLATMQVSFLRWSCNLKNQNEYRRIYIGLFAVAEAVPILRTRFTRRSAFITHRKSRSPQRSGPMPFRFSGIQIQSKKFRPSWSHCSGSRWLAADRFPVRPIGEVCGVVEEPPRARAYTLKLENQPES